MVLNSAYPNSDRAQSIRADLISRYDVTCVCADCLELDERAVTDIIKGVLYEFPVKELDLFQPPWVDALPYDHPIKSGLYAAIREGCGVRTPRCGRRGRRHRGVRYGQQRPHHVHQSGNRSGRSPDGSAAEPVLRDLVPAVRLCRPRRWGSAGTFVELSMSNGNTTKLREPWRVRRTGCSIVVPGTDELVLEEPEIVRQGADDTAYA